MGTVLLVMNRFTATKLQWRWWIPLISLFVSVADFAYFYALSYDDALIAVISMIRRGSVIDYEYSKVRKNVSEHTEGAA